MDRQAIENLAVENLADNEDPPLIVTTTSDNAMVIDAIAASLVEDRLAACCQVSPPVTSVYRWEDKIERAAEWELKVKTVASRLDAVFARIDQLHNYDVPQIIAVEIACISRTYGDWVAANTGPQ